MLLTNQIAAHRMVFCFKCHREHQPIPFSLSARVAIFVLLEGLSFLTTSHLHRFFYVQPSHTHAVHIKIYCDSHISFGCSHFEYFFCNRFGSG